MNRQKGFYDNKRSLKKAVLRLIGFGVAVVSLLFMVSCIPDQTPSPIFTGVNTESPLMDISVMVDTTMSYRFRDGWHGAINPGDTLMLYSDLPELTSGGHLQVYCPVAGAEGLGAVGYYNVDQYPTETADLIRDYYLNVQPTTSIFQIRNMVVSWSNAGTEFPVYNIVIPTDLPGDDGTLYHVQILGGAAASSPPPIQTVDSSGNVISQMDTEGRTLIVRRGNSTSQPIIDATNMSSSALTPTIGVSTTFLPQITTELPLAYMIAGLFPSTTGGCYDGNGGIKGTIQSTQDPLTLKWTYYFHPTIYSTGTLAANTCYAFVVGISDKYLLKSGAPTEMLTQGMGATTVTDNTGAFQEDLGTLTCGTLSNITILPYYFCTGS